MNYKITICHPDKKEIETVPRNYNIIEAKEFFNNYQWKKELELMSSMKIDDVQYNPSIRFTNISNNISLELTAEIKNEKISFSLWYERPKMTKILFGILGEKKKMQLIEKWNFNFESSQLHLSSFLNQEYDKVEKVMND